MKYDKPRFQCVFVQALLNLLFNETPHFICCRCDLTSLWLTMATFSIGHSWKHEQASMGLACWRRLVLQGTTPAIIAADLPYTWTAFGEEFNI